MYDDSEELLGMAGAGEDFIIDSKIKGGFEPGSAERSGVIDGVDLSLERLKIGKLDIFYIHAPDHDVPIEETLEAIDDVFCAGKCERFGLSKRNPKDVEAVHDHCKAKGYMLLTAYQGNYSAVARKLESDLFPVLRRLNITFYAYSPIAGGFLTKTIQQVLDGAGRFSDSAPGGGMCTKDVQETCIPGSSTRVGHHFEGRRLQQGVASILVDCVQLSAQWRIRRRSTDRRKWSRAVGANSLQLEAGTAKQRGSFQD